MATYKEKVGTAVVNVAGNYPGAVDGQLWYDSSSKAYKYQFISSVGAWASTNSLNTARYALGGAGIQTSALVFGGETSPGPQVATTQTWNGTNWTTVNNMNTARYSLGGSGIQTSALAYGGQTPNVANVELWNGTNWAEVNDLSTAKFRVGNAGADNTSALCFGGRNSPGTRYTDTELWNGTNWTEVNNLNQAKDELGSSGIATAALGFGGNVPPATANTEEWNGTNWAEVNNLSNITLANAGTGTTNYSLNAAGLVGGNASTIAEEWAGAGASVTRTIDTD